MLTRPAYKYNYNVLISYFESAEQAHQALEFAFSSVSGGEVEYDIIEEHVDHKSNFKSSSQGRASVTDLTCELGAYKFDGLDDDAKNKGGTTNNQFHKIMQNFKLDSFKCTITVYKVLLDSSTKTPADQYERTIYDNCTIKNLAFGEFSSTSEELIVQKMVFKPDSVEIIQGNSEVNLAE